METRLAPGRRSRSGWIRLGTPVFVLAAASACGTEGPGFEAAGDDASPGSDRSRPSWRRLGPEDGLVPLAMDLARIEEKFGIWLGGVAAADFDGDGAVDLFFTNPTGPDGLYFGDPFGRFQEAGNEAGVAGSGGDFECGAGAADYDGDGRVDLLVHGVGLLRMYRNAGDRTFEDATAGSGIDDGVERFTFGAAFGDYDGDGHLDLLLASYSMSIVEGVAGDELPTWPGDGSRLLHNRGDGTFEEATHLLPAGSLTGWTIQGRWYDVDSDGDLDALLINDYGASNLRNQVLRNDGPDGAGQWRFTAIDPGLDASLDGMGIDFADADRDGDLDAVISDLPGIVYLEGDGQGAFVDATAVSGLGILAELNWVGWATRFEDLDNDGRDDLVVAFSYVHGAFANAAGGEGNDIPRDQPIVTLWGGSDGLDPEPDTDALGSVDDRLTAAPADVNRDGVVDWVLGLDEEGPVVLVSTPAEVPGHWLEVRVDRPGHPNRYGIGATVTVEQGGVVTRRVLEGGGGVTFSSPEPFAHFGLGSSGRAERVRVEAPDGESWVLEDVEADRVVVVGG